MRYVRFKINSNFLQSDVSSWSENDLYLKDKSQLETLKAIKDIAERAVMLMQDFYGLLTADEEQKQFLLRCVQEHRKVFPDCIAVIYIFLSRCNQILIT